MNATVEYADFALAANSWAEFETYEITASCSNPFLQIWKGGIPPLYDTRDDARILAEVSAALADEIGEPRLRDYWRFVLEGRPEIYIQRLLDASLTTSGYRVEDIIAGKYGEPGAALMLFRTYPRIPFWEQIHDSVPFYTDTGRLNSYCDIPEAIEYGENIISHREGPEATPYLPNVIVTRSRFVRPEDYGIPADHMGWEERTVRNIALPWEKVKETKNPLWEQGFHFYCLTPKTRHRVHSSWSTVDWTIILDSNFGDPYRADKRLPGPGDHQLHMNPQAARDLGIEDGDDTLFHKQKVSMQFIFGGEADNHALNTVPKETLVRIVKAEDGGLDGKGPWEPTKTGYTPAHENEFMLRYLAGETIEVNG
jgi:nitrate reductase alpha subunit